LGTFVSYEENEVLWILARYLMITKPLSDASVSLDADGLDVPHKLLRWFNQEPIL